MVREQAVDDQGVDGDDDGGEDDDEGEEQRHRHPLRVRVGVAQAVVAEGEGLVEGLDGVEGEEADGEHDDDHVVDDVAVAESVGAAPVQRHGEGAYEMTTFVGRAALENGRRWGTFNQSMVMGRRSRRPRWGRD